MQMLGLSNTKMFSFFLRIMACCLRSLGDLTSEGGSLGSGGSRVWERAGGRGTRQISGGAEDSRPAPCASGRPFRAPHAGEVGGCLPGTGGGDTGKASCPTLLRMRTDISPVLPWWGRGSPESPGSSSQPLPHESMETGREVASSSCQGAALGLGTEYLRRERQATSAGLCVCETKMGTETRQVPGEAGRPRVPSPRPGLCGRVSGVTSEQLRHRLSLAAGETRAPNKTVPSLIPCGQQWLRRFKPLQEEIFLISSSLPPKLIQVVTLGAASTCLKYWNAELKLTKN
ncbi:uncharacterized protein LOC130708056 isoform X2 [Balaenoptera acutorostrata]|uniref:Uncharacterized protein LOC130708056 isoform X2 n=1 Tax=Balaenoptera acutorostrata TaxID=9767 RepID=A0ABM3TFG4_BALAC|nr:uncharacterized protein LOC130708056 isoform X2 [Balaenoptera acutorostrata]